MIVRKAAAAFAAGCSVVVKAPRETPHSALAFGVLIERAGGPKGLYNVICTNRSSLVGKALCEHPLVSDVFQSRKHCRLTLQTGAQNHLHRFYAGRQDPHVSSCLDVVKVLFRAGWQCSFVSGARPWLSFQWLTSADSIVFDDADVEKAAESAAGVKFRCSGQVCIAANRLLVQEGIHDKFVAALTAKVKKFSVGYGLGSCLDTPFDSFHESLTSSCF